MTAHLDLPPHKVVQEDGPDGTILLRSGYEMPTCAGSTNEWLERWATQTPERIFLAERSGPGWRTISYGEVLRRVESIAAGLLARGVHGPILILSGNSIDHALLILAAHYVCLVTVPVAEQYSLIPAAHDRLKYIVDLVQPDLVFASDAEVYADAMRIAACPCIASKSGDTGAVPLDSLTGDRRAAQTARAQITPDTIAKLLFTSGSTSEPKAVETTQRMMTNNQAQFAHCLPFQIRKNA